MSDSRLTNLLCNKITVAKSKEVETESNLAESSKEDYGSKRDVLQMTTTTTMMTMMMMVW
jgi:hypothetical protein